ncbi:hypothetical protein KDX23_10180 [Burkholderia vietnamiensis]|uniref:hypothetical protein n=1 Tax=Burkholderia vietnamiensis TaxID=60552 RepID=UPI001B9A4B79|nr:hypothetical protein [Burkholderia vietnamiensis]MBR8083111.1 hypothetical protein [Burkholderia vietnamiensis]
MTQNDNKPAAAPIDASPNDIPEGCTPADAQMLREANHALAAENDSLRRALRPFARIVSVDKLSWAMVEYCVEGDPEKQTFQSPQMQRAFNRAADMLRNEFATQAASGEIDDVQVSRDGFSGGNPAVDSPARDFRLSSEPADERAAKKSDAMTKAVKQLADWLLTDPNEGNPLCFAGPPEPFVLGLSRVKMRSIAGDEWTLIAGLQEGWLTAEQRASNFWRIANLEREEVAREEAVAQYKEIRARAASANETGAEGATWRELCRRLYVELFHCDQQMRSTRDEDGEPHWTQSAVVRDVLADARAALDGAPQPPAQADARVGLTDEQRTTIQHAADKLRTVWANHTGDKESRELCHKLEAILAGANHAE